MKTLNTFKHRYQPRKWQSKICIYLVLHKFPSIICKEALENAKTKHLKSVKQKINHIDVMKKHF